MTDEICFGCAESHDHDIVNLTFLIKDVVQPFGIILGRIEVVQFVVSTEENRILKRIPVVNVLFLKRTIRDVSDGESLFDERRR